MKIIDGASIILHKAWSIRLTILSIILTGIEATLAMLDADLLGIPPGTFAILAGVVSVSAMIARVVAQPVMQRQVKKEEDDA